MSKYNPTEFIKTFFEKTHRKGFPNCPYCGGQKFTSTDKYAAILIGEDLKNVSIGPTVPAGMVICENCGHIEFFALGALGLLNRPEGEGNANE